MGEHVHFRHPTKFVCAHFSEESSNLHKAENTIAYLMKIPILTNP